MQHLECMGGGGASGWGGGGGSKGGGGGKQGSGGGGSKGVGGGGKGGKGRRGEGGGGMLYTLLSGWTPVEVDMKSSDSHMFVAALGWLNHVGN